MAKDLQCKKDFQVMIDVSKSSVQGFRFWTVGWSYATAVCGFRNFGAWVHAYAYRHDR